MPFQSATRSKKSRTERRSSTRWRAPLPLPDRGGILDGLQPSRNRVKRYSVGHQVGASGWIGLAGHQRIESCPIFSRSHLNGRSGWDSALRRDRRRPFLGNGRRLRFRRRLFGNGGRRLRVHGRLFGNGGRRLRVHGRDKQCEEDRGRAQNRIDFHGASSTQETTCPFFSICHVVRSSPNRQVPSGRTLIAINNSPWTPV
jgi:hypothetical protein